MISMAAPPFSSIYEYEQIKEIINTLEPSIDTTTADFNKIIDLCLRYLYIITTLTEYSEQTTSTGLTQTTIKHRFILARLIIYFLKNSQVINNFTSIRLYNIQMTLNKNETNRYWDAFVEEVYRMGYELTSPAVWEAKIIKEYDPNNYINTPNPLPPDF